MISYLHFFLFTSTVNEIPKMAGTNSCFYPRRALRLPAPLIADHYPDTNQNPKN